MARLRDVAKRDLVALEQGLTIGRPKDILVDPERHKVVAVVVAYGSVPHLAVVCRAQSVRDFSGDVLAIDSLKSLQFAFQDEETLELIRRGIKVRGRAVISSQGKRVGHISEVEVDERGNVVQYLVRRGPLGWLGSARPLTPNELQSIGVDVVVMKRGISERAADEREQGPPS